MTPSKQKEFKTFVKQELKIISKKINKKIEELEDASIPVGSYSEVGVSLFETFILTRRINTYQSCGVCNFFMLKI